LDVRDVEREDEWTDGERSRSESGVDGRASRDRRQRLAENDQGYESAEVTQSPGKPWGFFLVLAAMLVVALLFSVTMVILREEIAPATAIGAMSAAFAVIGTLVGTYFGIKAGLDGQEKVRESVDKAIRGEERLRDRDRREGRSRDRDRREYE
jgi:hypothetical protein